MTKRLWLSIANYLNIFSVMIFVFILSTASLFIYVVIGMVIGAISGVTLFNSDREFNKKGKK